MEARFDQLSTIIKPLLEIYFKRVSVFGSYARGDATSESDIDLLVALKPSYLRPPLGLLGLVRLEMQLEDSLGRKVELITEEGLNHRIRKSVNKDKVLLYEEI